MGGGKLEQSLFINEEHSNATRVIIPRKKGKQCNASKPMTQTDACDLGGRVSHLDALVVAVHGAQAGQVDGGSGPGRLLRRGCMLWEDRLALAGC